MNSASEIQELFSQKIQKLSSLSELNEIRVEFLGKKGYLTEALNSISQLPPEERKPYGKLVNSLKQDISQKIEQLKSDFEEQELTKKLLEDKIDISLPPRNYKIGKQHPINKAILDLKGVFTRMGFTFDAGPDIEDEWNNFTALNIPQHHPARQMHDTFYLEYQKDLLLRTHTSCVQIRHMRNHKPPVKVISIGKVYRSDYDATHTPMFHQIEGLYIGKNVTISHLKSYLELFLQLFFEVEKAPIRLRPSYFPFTEPSAEADVKCDRSSKGEIKIGIGNDWLEILGCGMVHPKVLENMGVDPEEYQGFAFGAGIERLAMLKYNIPDLRTFFEGDIRWIQHYGF